MADDQKPVRQKLTHDQRIARHEQAIAKLRTQQKRKDRKADTRQKIVVGGTVIAAMRDDNTFRDQIVALLAQKVTKDVDREVVAEWLLPTSTPAQ